MRRILLAFQIQERETVAKFTKIQWAHSSLNLMAGCDGCELWIPQKGIFKCYAGKQIDGDGKRPGFKGQKGWPLSFDRPTLFLDRLDEALKWGPPTEKERALKPWIPNYPRLIFLNDMGDTFTKSLPLEWLAPILPKLAASPHIWMILTKRPARMVDFSRLHRFPRNVWVGTSITSESTIARADHLRLVQTDGPRFLSIEPIWGFIPEATYQGINWAIVGGESGDGATETRLSWTNKVVGDCFSRDVPVFVKQLGSRVIDWGTKDSHGGDWSEFPEELQVRELPALA